MGTVLQVEVQAPTRVTGLVAAEAALRAVEEVERRLSTWDERSELSRFNRADPGVMVEISADLAADLGEMRSWWRVTAGAYHPGLASLVTTWNLRGDGRMPSPIEVARALEAASMDHLELTSHGARRLHPEFGIEEGGFGKGAALRRATSSAIEAGARCVFMDFGGQVAMAGRCDPRRVDVAHPDERGRPVATIWLAAGSLATSGNSERGLWVAGTETGHLLDPATGRSAPDFGSVTVATGDPVAADCLATALFVLGPDRGVAWVDGRDGVEALFAIRNPNGSVALRPSAGMAAQLVKPEAVIGPAAGELETETNGGRRFSDDEGWRN